MKERFYLCIDLKSFYASVECVERGLDPMHTNLVVADESRTEKTICLAVTPALKAYGIPGRARLFEVVQKVREINKARRAASPRHFLDGESYDARELKANPSLELTYIVARPRMAYYMEYSTKIYDIYLKYVAHEDIHVYSVDEVFIDITTYLNAYKQTPYRFAQKIINEVYRSTGITATAGIGTNMYLAKIAMDIVAKHMPADKNGARIAELDEMSYRRQLWSHKPITDFWRVGGGYARKLHSAGLYTMGDVAACSVSPGGEKLLYKMFGVNAELLIDHAWGWEPCTIEHIKSYKPQSKSLGSGQVLHCAYDFEGGKLIVREMTELLCLELVDKKLVTDQMILTVGYDIENLKSDSVGGVYKGEITSDCYGRKIPKQAHSSTNIGRYTSSARLIVDAVLKLYDKIVHPDLLVRRINVVANHIIDENDVKEVNVSEQLNFFTDYTRIEEQKKKEEADLKKERKIQETVIELKNRFGKNAVLKGTNLKEGATAKDRNRQIGGHRA